MFIYAFGKGARLGYFPKRYRAGAEHPWKSVQKRFVQRDLQGRVILPGTVTHISMGATPKDDGSDSYYLKAPVVSDDPKGIGAFLLAGSEMDLRHKQ
jgi:unsaturated rhamnogalacturonyl hydrolase